MAWAYAALAGLQLVQGLQQADTIRQQAELTKQLADMNAEFAEVDAFNAELEGYSKAARYQNVVNNISAEQTAAYAAQGVDSTFGTAAEIKKETEAIGQLNTLDIMDEAHARALGFKREARNIRLNARMGGIEATARAGSTVAAAAINAATTYASGYAQKK